LGIRAYADLLRLHFFFVWPVLFSAGLFLGFTINGGFSPILVLQAILIAYFGFEAGLILNDIVDVNFDRKELPNDNKLTKYWRPFGKRPLSGGMIKKRSAVALFMVFMVITIVLISTLPYPHSVYVFVLMVVCYALEVFYQIKKRKQKAPYAQILGRVDFALFLVAGYLCVGSPDMYALALFLFFYPLALAHLGVNDLIDVVNDQAKSMKTPTTLYGIKATTYWVFGFTIIHYFTAALFLYLLGSLLALGGFAISFALLAFANITILEHKTPLSALKALPFLHLSMLIYAISIIVNYALAAFF
jgi:4-hydroxybenzoate polyprenyltransferase